MGSWTRMSGWRAGTDRTRRAPSWGFSFRYQLRTTVTAASLWPQNRENPRRTYSELGSESGGVNVAKTGRFENRRAIS